MYMYIYIYIVMCTHTHTLKTRLARHDQNPSNHMQRSSQPQAYKLRRVKHGHTEFHKFRQDSYMEYWLCGSMLEHKSAAQHEQEAG